MRLPLKEPIFAKYLYISPDNVVHVLMPVVSSSQEGMFKIGLDNTCKAVFSLQEFFGKGSNSNLKATVKGELLAYKKTLENDLSLLGAETLLAQQKQERLTQINAYLEVVKRLEKHPELDCLNNRFPSYPRPLEAFMQDRANSNLYSMVLRPTVEDGFLRTEAANPIFSVAHKSAARGIENSVSPLQQALIKAYRPLSYEAKDLKSQVIHQVLAQLSPGVPLDFELLRKTLQQTVKSLMNIEVNFTETQENKPFTQADLEKWFPDLESQTSTPQEYIVALVAYCAPGLFETVVDSPFNTLIQAEEWSIATQFLLGLTNIYAVTQEKLSADTNWGHILDTNPALSTSLAQTLAKAQQENLSIEETYLSWMNAHTKQLKLKTSWTQEEFKAIKETFALRYAEIKESPHFDEFFILNAQNKGNFLIHQGSICTHFAKFACSPLLNLPKELTNPLEKACVQANSLSTKIPHQNPLVQGDVEINTATLDNTALQALYKKINAYQDSKLKKQLFAQLKQERPDFKPQIDAKQFLQHIAYGEQNEAETLLQKDPELAQELLKAHNIPFTDYSGRTFTCTAYEYAWWAKDTHMLKMLEKYIKQDEETRQFILDRVNAIEELVNPPATPAHFHPPQKPRGLHYTTQNKQEQTIDHWENHFDLTPLKEALRTFNNAYNQSPKETVADWEALNKIWIEVGLPQREVPAHIAQEYCHPNRSFFDVFKNKSLLSATKPDGSPIPANLERQLKFYNNETNAWDIWFTRDVDSADSELGSSFAILRGRGWPMRRLTATSGAADRDLSAIEAIDVVRTGELQQLLESLSRPVIVHEPPV